MPGGLLLGGEPRDRLLGLGLLLGRGLDLHGGGRRDGELHAGAEVGELDVGGEALDVDVLGDRPVLALGREGGERHGRLEAGERDDLDRLGAGDVDPHALGEVDAVPAGERGDVAHLELVEDGQVLLGGGEGGGDGGDGDGGLVRHFFLSFSGRTIPPP